ncbi:MAG: DinB family protein [Pirellulales bacterium]
MAEYLADLLYEFRRHKELADRALARLSDEAFFHRPSDAVNSVALVVKHLAGNLKSRWTEVLTTDGEKPWRDRDQEFAISDADSRASLMAAWEDGWRAVLDAVASLTPADLDKAITIRGERHTVTQALLRGLTHAAYHTGQILYLARLLEPDGEWLTIAPGKSGAHRGEYRKK